MRTYTQILLSIARKKKILRTADLVDLGIPRVALTRLCRAGGIHRIGRGLYSAPNADVSEHYALAAAASRVPRGVVCLLSALHFHGLTTQQPFEVWIAIDRKARRPSNGFPPLSIVRFSGDAMTKGIRVHQIDGVRVLITEPARTVVDCFRYRTKVGVDVAVEALREYRRLRHGTIDALQKFAQARGVARVIRPYLEAMI